MVDFDIVPLYPKEAEWDKGNFEEQWQSHLTSKGILKYMRSQVMNIGVSMDKHAFCLIINIKRSHTIVKSTDFCVDTAAAGHYEKSKVIFFKLLSEPIINEVRENEVSADIDIAYESDKNIRLTINGIGYGLYFRCELSQKYEKMLPFVRTTVDLTDDNGCRKDTAELYITSMLHTVCCSDNALKIVDKLFETYNHPYVTIQEFRTGWTNYFGMPKYIPPRKGQLFERSSLEMDINRARETLDIINSSPFNVLMCSYSLFAMCRSLFSNRAYKPFLLNIVLPKPEVGDNDSAAVVQKMLSQYVLPSTFGGLINEKVNFYGDNQKIIDQICEIPYCFFAPERKTTNANNDLFAIDKAFSPASTYEIMLKADSDYFSKAKFKDFPVVLSGISKRNMYDDHMVKKVLKEYSFLRINRKVTDKIVESHLKSPLSFILVDAEVPKDKSDSVINFKLTPESSGSIPNYLVELKNSFILFLERKMYVSLSDYSENELNRLREKLLIVENEVINEKFKSFLKKLSGEMKEFPGGRQKFLSANYIDILKMYASDAYKNNISCTELLVPLYNDISNRRSSYRYSFSHVKKILHVSNKCEEQCLREIISDDIDCWYFSKFRDYSKKEAKTELKEKMTQWNDNYTLSVIAKYVAASQRKSSYISDKFKAVSEIIERNNDIPSEIRNVLKCLLTIITCFSDFIGQEFPELREQSDKLVENTMRLWHYLYTDNCVCFQKELNANGAVRQFCEYLCNLKNASTETTSCQKFIRLLADNKDKSLIGWYDIKKDDYYLLYEGINDCEVYQCFINYLEKNNYKTNVTFKQILRSLRDDYSAVYTRPSGNSTHYQSHKKIDGADRKLYRFYGSKFEAILK